MNAMIIFSSKGLKFIQFNVRGWLLAAHTEKQTLQAGPFETCSQQPKDTRFRRPGERHVRDSPTIEMVFISMYDPFPTMIATTLILVRHKVRRKTAGVASWAAVCR